MKRVYNYDSKNHFKNDKNRRKRTIEIDDSKNSKLIEAGIKTLEDRYIHPNETIQDLFARVACFYSNNDEHAQRLYNYISDLWFTPSTPVLSNGGSDRALPISCFVNDVGDSLEQIFGTYNENGWLASRGGGIGTNFSNVRSIGEKISVFGGTTSGVIPFIKIMDSQTLGVSQGNTRRGSAAVYLDIDHPEIEEFIDIRRPTGGDPNRRCLNIHHGVNITDDFMNKALKDEEFDLISPRTKEVVKTVKARELYIRILQARLETGEPYIIHIDTVNNKLPLIYRDLNLKVQQSNLCVAPETLILTDRGYEVISSMKDKEVNIWNGKEFSKVTVKKTGSNQKLLNITFSDGASIDCTPYHKFYIQKDYSRKNIQEIRACDLQNGMKIIKWEKPIINFDGEFNNPYWNGFFTGDGCHTEKKDIIYFYGMKKNILDDSLNSLGTDNFTINYNSGGDRHIVRVNKKILYPKFTVPIKAKIDNKIEWLAGLFDADGALTNNQGAQSIQLVSVNKEFLLEIRLMLQTLGVSSKISFARKEGSYELPDGKGGVKKYKCKESNRLLITEEGIQKLLKLGYNDFSKRIKPVARKPNRSADHFVKIETVNDYGRIDDTYCFTEPKRNMGVFNGILTGQCAEIMLHTGMDYLNRERTGVCCLSSLNLETHNQWKDNEQFLEDVLYFLDNVLQDFINQTLNVKGFEKARYSAMMERSIGLGVMGFHSYLQQNNIPFESKEAKAFNKKFFKWFSKTSNKINHKAALDLGTNMDYYELKKMKPDTNLKPVRWANTSAVAPTASISIIAGGSSAGIEPCPANAYTQKTLSGSLPIKNRYLDKIIKLKIEELKEFDKIAGADYDEEHYQHKYEDIWSSITINDGSVQHLEILTSFEKSIFKTSWEIDQSYIIDYAADRAPYITQGASNNIFVEPDIDKAKYLAIHIEAWKKGVPSLYYVRSKSLGKAVVSHTAGEMPQPREEKRYAIEEVDTSEPEICEACQ